MTQARSLHGRHIVVTRPEPAEGPMHEALVALGARVEPVPVLDVRPPANDRALRDALALLPEADWLIVTSPRAVEVLAELSVFEAAPPERLQVAVVGERTAQAVRQVGWPVHLVPEPAGAIPLLLALESQGVGARDHVIFPASARARSVLPDGLRARGARVTQVVAYEPTEQQLDSLKWRGLTTADALVFNSPSAVEALTAGLEGSVVDALRAVPAAVQGPTTAVAAHAAGWTRVIEASPRTFEGLARTLAQALGPAPSASLTS